MVGGLCDVVRAPVFDARPISAGVLHRTMHIKMLHGIATLVVLYV